MNERDAPGLARFKVWSTSLTNWHVHARHPETGSWIAEHGIYSEDAAMRKGDSFCDALDEEACRWGVTPAALPGRVVASPRGGETA